MLKVYIQNFWSKFIKNNSTMNKQHIHNTFTFSKLNICSNKDFLLNNAIYVFTFVVEKCSYHMTIAISHFNIMHKQSTKKEDDVVSDALTSCFSVLCPEITCRSSVLPAQVKILIASHNLGIAIDLVSRLLGLSLGNRV